MGQETSPLAAQLDADRTVVSAFDETDTGRTFIIADISRDESWLSAAAGDIVSLNDHV